MANQLDAALADCNEALRLVPNDEKALDSRGFVKLKLGQLEAAIRDFDAALRIDPKLFETLYGRGIAKRRNGDIAGGNSDMAIEPMVEEEFNSYGLK
jgi:tetratricopeptide (TPR) repeat protein